MTASWNSTGEVDWPADQSGPDPERFKPDWSSFEDSLRAHGFEVAPPSIEETEPETQAAAGWTSDGVSQTTVEEASRSTETGPGAEPELEPATASSEPGLEPPTDETAATDAGSYWSFESEEPTWIVADEVEEQPAAEAAAPAGDEERPAAEAAVSAGDAERPAAEAAVSAGDAERPAAEAASVSAGPAAEEPGPSATAAADPDEPTSAWDALDDADAPVLPDVGEPLERGPVSVFADETGPATAGAVFLADEPGAHAPGDVESVDDEHSAGGSEPGTGRAPDGDQDAADRWWTEPDDTVEAASAVDERAASADDSAAREDAIDVPQADGDAPSSGDEMGAAGNVSAAFVDPTHGAHAPQTLPDDRLPTPPADLFARFARRSAVIAPAIDGTGEAAPSDSEQVSGETSVTDGAAASDEPAAPAEPVAFVPWTYEASDAAPTSEAQAAPFDAVTAASGATPDDAFGASPETGAGQPDGWTQGTDHADWKAAESVDDAGAGDAARWSDWSTVAAATQGAEPAHSTEAAQATESTEAAEMGHAAEAPAAIELPDSTAQPAAAADAAQPAPEAPGDEASVPTDGEAGGGMAVDWYEAAAIEAVGTSSDVELSNTEFVGYDVAPAAAPAAEGLVDGADHNGAAALSAREPGADGNGSEMATSGDDHRDALGWAVVGAATAPEGWDTTAAQAHGWRADDEWPEATDVAATVSADSENASTGEQTPSEPVAAAAVAATEATPGSGAATTDGAAWPVPDAVDWEAADQDAWSAPAATKWNDSESAAAAAAVAATGMAAASTSSGASSSISASVADGSSKTSADARSAAYTTSGAPTGSGLFGRYDTSPAMTVSAASAGAATAGTPTATSPRGESDLWHLVSDPAAAAPASSEKRSFDPVTVFLTVLVAIIIVALLLGLLYTVAPLLTGAAH